MRIPFAVCATLRFVQTSRFSLVVMLILRDLVPHICGFHPVFSLWQVQFYIRDIACVSNWIYVVNLKNGNGSVGQERKVENNEKNKGADSTKKREGEIRVSRSRSMSHVVSSSQHSA